MIVAWPLEGVSATGQTRTRRQITVGEGGEYEA